MTCPAEFPVFIGPGGWSPLQVWPTDRPAKLVCILENGHEGAHCSPPPDGVGPLLAWEFIAASPGVELAATAPESFELPDPPDFHPNCKCTIGPLLPSFIDPTERIPAWWVAERCDEVFGVTSPRIFHPIFEHDPPPYVQKPTGEWDGPAF